MTECFFNGAPSQHGAAPGPEASVVLVLVASWAVRPEQRHPPHQEGILLPEPACPAANSRGWHECPGASGTNDHKLEGLKLQTFILSHPEAGSLSSRCRQGRTLSETCRGGSFLPRPAPGGPRLPWLQPRSPSSRGPVPRVSCPPSTCEDTRHWIRAPGWPHLKVLNLITSTKTFFRISSGM